ncbi:SirB1 family protein [Pseudomonas sp. LP_7_YM]|uniref:SirB1 family protein n=1 Tax=Pseudomonas sp. LP_7_YM TaxID=2485137 RepID=UPI00105E68F6|nr:transglutaminase family protein [Pseudomonas sp. LP_7_YM]TDV69816.1 regulator of sirC expression with transglutaminase-like and TPR domain [Pseudomonas sp. LP_7_YM]
MNPRQQCLACLRSTPARTFEAALWICVEHDAQVDPRQTLERLDQLKRQIGAELPMLPAAELAQPLLRSMAMIGFQQDDRVRPGPQSALMNKIIEHRRGQPLGLALVALELARRLQIPLEGVNFPGHFLLRVPGADHALNPCDGRRLYSKDCRELLLRQFGSDIPLEAQHLRAATPQIMLQRLSRNLRHLHQINDDLIASLEDANRVLEMGEANTSDYLARAGLYQTLDCAQAERHDLEYALMLSDDPVQRIRLTQRLVTLPGPGGIH